METQMIDLMGVSEKVLRSDRVVAVQPRKRFMRSFHEKVSKSPTKIGDYRSS